MNNNLINNIINLNQVGKDNINGGVFFGSDMTPSGVFKNIPRYDYVPFSTEKEAELILTLNKVKHSINENLMKEKGYEISSTEDLQTFTNTYINLLIDYRDLRNYIFFGSANTEIAYQINNLINTYPYKTLVAERQEKSDISIVNKLIGGRNYTEIVFPYYVDNNKGADRMIRDNWNKFITDDTLEALDVNNLQVVDKNDRRYDISEIVTPYKNDSDNYIVTGLANANTTIGGLDYGVISVRTLQPINVTSSEIFFDKIFLNGELSDPDVRYGPNNTIVKMSSIKYRIVKILTNFEMLVMRKTPNNSLERINIVNYNPNDIYAGIFNFDRITTIYDAVDVLNINYNSRNLIGVQFYGGSLNNDNYQTPTNYKFGDIISFFDVHQNDIPLDLKYKVTNYEGNFEYTLNAKEERFKVIDIIHTPNTSNTFLDTYTVVLERENKLSANEEMELLTPFSNIHAKTRLSDITKNGQHFWVKLLVKGYLSYENLIPYLDNEIAMKGFMISPTLKVIGEFDNNLDSLQKYLLSPMPINKIPWPRRIVTNNIMNILEQDYDPNNMFFITDTEREFYDWINNPELLHEYEFGELPDDVFNNNVFYEYQLARTVYSDETNTNQLLRRAIPYEITDELSDPEYYFSRFILTAGWLFDQIKVYIDFIKYVFTINYGEFNQLSPEFYKLYANQYGFDLFEDEDIDFGKLVIETKPGFYYSNDNSSEENKYFTKTLQQIQYDRQKKLLVSLMHLYKMKGVKGCIEKMVSLIGAPDGFLSENEYSFKVRNTDAFGMPINSYEGDIVVNNEKIAVPDFKFEIDLDALKDKMNIDNPINKPYVYKKVYNNDYEFNLRELSVDINVNNSIQKHISDIFGNQLYNFISLNNLEYSNLQRKDGYLLPLTIPDRYYGFSIEYMIPKNGYNFLEIANLDQCTYNLFNLYEIEDVQLYQMFNITDITLDESMTEATITTNSAHGYAVDNTVYIMNNTGIGGINKSFVITNIVSTTQFKIIGNFSNESSTVTYGIVTLQGINKPVMPSDNTYSYPVPGNRSNVLEVKYENTYVDSKQYIMARIEGKDLVFRLRLQSERDGSFEERVAIAFDLMKNDGLIHSLRFTIINDGIEIYSDYNYIGIAKFMDLNANIITPVLAYQATKQQILDAYNDTINCNFNYYIPLPDLYFKVTTQGNLGDDKLRWWDMFTGLGENITCFTKKLNIYENVTINDFNIGDKLTEENSYTAELYLFEVAGDKTANAKYEYTFNIPAIFYKKNINNIVDYYGYQLETEIDEFGRSVIKDLGLQYKTIAEVDYNLIRKYNNIKQTFFRNTDIFKFNAWFKEIHESYDYKNFNGDLYHLYNIYSMQVLTYNSLLDFLGFVEGKFKNVILKFIPMVINISNFGKLIANADIQMPKMRYNNKFCLGFNKNDIGFFANKLFKVTDSDTDGLIPDATMNIKLLHPLSGELYSKDFAFDDSNEFTLRQLVDAINLDFGFNVAEYYYGLFRLKFNKQDFYNLYTVDLNEVSIEVSNSTDTLTFSFSESFDAGLDIIPEQTNNCGIITQQESKYSEECGFISYNFPVLMNNDLYTYYIVEGQEAPAIYFKSENNLQRNIIKFKSE